MMAVASFMVLEWICFLRKERNFVLVKTALEVKLIVSRRHVDVVKELLFEQCLTICSFYCLFILSSAVIFDRSY